MVKQIDQYRTLVPDQMTQPLQEWISANAELVTFGHRMFHMADLADKGVSARVIRLIERLDKRVNFDSLVEALRDSETPAKSFFRPFISRYEKLMAEMTLCRAVDNFETYITSLLKLVFIHRPETLRSRETVMTKDVLQHTSIDDFVLWLAEKRVLELAYKGVRHLNQFFEKRLGVSMLLKTEMPEAERIIETRHLLVHNRGVKNERFVSRVGKDRSELGARLQLSLHEATQAAVTLWSAVVPLDSRVVEKFGLPTSGHPGPQELRAEAEQA